MGAEADRLRAEQEQLERDLKELQTTKVQEGAELEAHEHNLNAARERLQSAQATARPATDYETVKQQIRQGIQGKHGEVARELDDGWEAHTRYLDGARQDVDKEMREAKSERKRLQCIKVKLRDQGVAEFQTYTPSSMGSESPPAPLAQMSPNSYTKDKQGSQSLLPVGSPHTVPPTPEAE